MLFLLLAALGLAIAGLTAYLMMWPLVTTHLRDRQNKQRPRLGSTPFSPSGFLWFLRFTWRHQGDQNLSFLAFPASIAAWAIALGSVVAAVLYVLRITGTAV